MNVKRFNVIAVSVVIVGVLLVAVEGQSQSTIIPHTLYCKRLSKDAFFEKQDALEGDPVRFIASQKDLPDPPGWINFSQVDLEDDAFIYGSPSGPQDSVDMEVVAVNKRTQQTAYMTLELLVSPKSRGDAAYEMEFTLRDVVLADMLYGEKVEGLLEKWSFIWSADSQLLLSVVSLKPLVTIGINTVASGVVVRIMGNLDFSSKIKATEGNMQEACNDSLATPPAPPIDTHFSPHYSIDWCSFTLVKSSGNQPKQPVNRKIDLEDSTWKPDAIYKSNHRDMRLLFILCVVLPLALGLVLFVLFSIIMFGRREGVEKRNKQSTPTQMMHFNTIRQATSNLRLMSASNAEGDGGRPISRSATPASNPATRATTPRRSQTDLTTRSTSAPPTGATSLVRKKSDTSRVSVDAESPAQLQLVISDNNSDTLRIKK